MDKEGTQEGTLYPPLLFAETDVQAVNRLTGLALRVIRQSKQYEIGYSRRHTLQDEIARRIEKHAKETGRRRGEILQDFCERPAEHREAIADLLAESVDEIVASKSETAAQQLRAKLKDQA